MDNEPGSARPDGLWGGASAAPTGLSPEVETASGLDGSATSIPSAEETELLRRIAFRVAMIDREHSTEHDEALFDGAHEAATEWLGIREIHGGTPMAGNNERALLVIERNDGPEAVAQIKALAKEANDHSEAANRWRNQWGDEKTKNDVAAARIKELEEALRPFAYIFRDFTGTAPTHIMDRWATAIRDARSILGEDGRT
jgi:hypothetical protein